MKDAADKQFITYKQIFFFCYVSNSNESVVCAAISYTLKLKTNFVIMTSGVAQYAQFEYSSTHVLPSGLQEWVPPKFKNFNNCIFRSSNMQSIMDMLEEKLNAKKWNNILNASMHMMIKWDKMSYVSKFSQQMLSGQFQNLLQSR